MTINRNKIGKQNKRRGARAETEIGKLLSKELGPKSRIVRTPRSGGFAMSWKGDLIEMGESVLKDWLIEIKSGKQIPKKITDWISKLKDEAEMKDYFLYLLPKSESDDKYEYKEIKNHLIVVPAKIFIKILQELDGHLKEDKSRE